MQTQEWHNGPKSVFATRNDEGSKWRARLYVNDVPTLQSKVFKTMIGLERWVKRMLG